jgi:hypothetical protein
MQLVGPSGKQSITGRKAVEVHRTDATTQQTIAKQFKCIEKCNIRKR